MREWRRRRVPDSRHSLLHRFLSSVVRYGSVFEEQTTMRRFLIKVTLFVVGVTWPALPIQAARRVRVDAGTKLSVRLDRGISTKDFKQPVRSYSGVRTVTGTL